MRWEHLEAKNEHLCLTYDAFKRLGISYFSYGLSQKNKTFTYCMSSNEWCDHYKKNNYYKIDPLLRGVMDSNLPLIVWDALHPVGEAKKVMMERNEICKIKSGLTIGLFGKGTREIIGLGAEVSPKEFYELLKEENYLSEINHILKCFYAPFRAD
jgi:hypothetical protein